MWENDQVKYVRVSVQLLLVGAVLLVAPSTAGDAKCEDNDGPITHPLMDLSTDEIINYFGYPAETHYITTVDGYILTMHRIPNPGGVPVYLQHGFMDSSATWVLTGPGKALAFILADEGYDVWMGNFRGNRYSRNHVCKSVEDNEFWDFCWDDMGKKDVTAMIDHVLDVTCWPKLFHVGHSMGTTTFYVTASCVPEYNQKVFAHFSLAPVAFMKHCKSPIRYFTYWEPFLQRETGTWENGAKPSDLIEQIEKNIIDHRGKEDDLPDVKALKTIGKIALHGMQHGELTVEIDEPLKELCIANSTNENICKNFMFIIFGYDEKQMDESLIPVFLGHTPAGSSVKVMNHYAQEIDSGHFRQFDYHSPKQNLRHYNSVTPPKYDLNQITVPISLHYSSNDALAAVLDVQRLAKGLPNLINMQLVDDPMWNHIDFTWGIEAPKLVYENVISIMKNITMPPY
nr:PREDICTED: gastric triacylglycerol lipase-like [Bemisia tabaci]